MALMTTTDWLAFWNSPHSDLCQCAPQGRALPADRRGDRGARAGPQAHALDYRSGEALHADIVAAAEGELQFAKLRPACAQVQQRFADNPPKIPRIAPPHAIRGA